MDCRIGIELGLLCALTFHGCIKSSAGPSAVPKLRSPPLPSGHTFLLLPCLLLIIMHMLVNSLVGQIAIKKLLGVLQWQCSQQIP